MKMQIGNRPETARSPGSGSAENLAGLLAVAGRSDFYTRFPEFISGLVGSSRWIVLRFGAFDKPTVVTERYIGQDIIDLYLSGIYRLDPLFQLARTRPKAMVVNIRSGEHVAVDEEWMSGLLRIANITDELAVMLPIQGGATLAVGCERDTGKFSAGDVRLVSEMLPLLDAIHQVHLERVLAHLLNGQEIDQYLTGRQLALLLDQAGNRIVATTAWRSFEASERDFVLPMMTIGAADNGQVNIVGSRVLHWERLPDEFATAPGGKMLFIENRQAGPKHLTATDVVAAFERTYDLTPREAEIVNLVLNGFPNELIAGRLGIGVGTVRNHRWRLYNKLDITTERELFSLLLSSILNQEEPT